MNIIVVGGGTSGWLTISNLLFRIPKNSNIKITLIESKDIPIIGVGESTTGMVYQVLNDHNHLGGVLDFLKKTGATFKYGIKHNNWYGQNHSFISPIGSTFDNVTGYPTRDYDYIRIFHIAEKMKFEIPLQNKLMNQNKLYCINGLPNNPYKDLIGETGYKLVHDYDVAFHIDAFLTGSYLRDYCMNTGRVNRIEDTIQDVTKNEKGGIKSLKLKSGLEVNGDLFLDCSGWSRILMKYMDVKFIPYKDNLLVNKAMLFPIKNKEDTLIKNHMTATAQKYGWTFEIPLQDRLGRGYIFDGDMISDEQAEEEIKKVYEDVDVKKVIKYDTGRLNKFWIKNVIGVGLSSHFVEPLEATALHSSINEVNRFLEYYFTEHMDLYDKNLQDDFNGHMISLVDNYRDFLVFHYITPRKDTDFWIESSSEKRWSPELKRKMEIWKKRMPRQSDYHHYGREHEIGNSLWLQVGEGMHLFDSEIAKKELHYFNLYEKAKEDLKGIDKFSTYMCEHAMSNNEFYKKYL